jgi:hypothetical protein
MRPETAAIIIAYIFIGTGAFLLGDLGGAFLAIGATLMVVQITNQMG